MLNIYSTDANSERLKKIDKIQKGCWINLDDPTENEIQLVANETGAFSEYLRYPLDEEEKARFEVEDEQVLIILDMPYTNKDGSKDKLETIPMGIIIANGYFITVCSVANDIIDRMLYIRSKGLVSFKRTRLAIQIIFNISKEYLKKLRMIEKQIDRLEDSAHKNTENKDVFKLLEIQNTLVYYSTSLKGNEIVMERLMKSKALKMYEEDEDILEDAIIENRQAIEMAGIYSQITISLVEAFNSIISNNLNEVMKFLASLTILLSIPTIIFSFYGMNVPLPFEGMNHAVSVIGLGSIVLMGGIYLILRKNKMI